MTDFRNFKGTAKRLDDIDLPKLGALIGVGEDEIHAFIDVETRGSGFDDQGRPRILFERHKFWKYLPAAKRDEAVKAGLANKTAGGYGKESEQYSKLKRAMAIDEHAALLSCSWGLGQVMGFNHEAAGYDTVDEMILAFMEDEEAHLQAAIQFIITNKLDDELRAHNWAAFARGYNGTDYAKNQYDKKLDAAYKKWAKIADTPYQPAVVPVEPVVDPALDKDTILRVQTLLAEKGYPEVGQWDGKMGARTRNAILIFQADNGLPLTGEVTDDLLAALIKAPKRENSQQRETATKTDLKDRTIVQTGDTLQKAGAAITIGSIILGGVDSLDALNDRLTGLQKVYATVTSFGPWAVGAVAGGVALFYGRRVLNRYIQQYREGKAL